MYFRRGVRPGLESIGLISRIHKKINAGEKKIFKRKVHQDIKICDKSL